MKEIIYLSGLPRSGSTLLCNLLDKHSEISSTPSSPLCGLINQLRRIWSDDPFLLTQLDSNFEVVYKRLKRSLKAFMGEWSSDTNTPITIDKNRGWCHSAPTLQHLYPNFKMIVCLRDLRGVFSSIEKRHKETLLLDFPDHCEQHIVDKRAGAMFDDNGVIGGPLKAIYNLGDIPDIMRNIYFWRYEDFLSDPQKTMDELFTWIGVKTQKIDFDNIEQTTIPEADSFYRMKYMHKIKSKLEKPELRKLSPRIITSIVNRNKWYYEAYYPEISFTARSFTADAPTRPDENEIENEIIDELSNSIEESVAKEKCISDNVLENKKKTPKKKTSKKKAK